MVLKVNNITKTKALNNILTDVTFNVTMGEIIGIIGPSGSGKSTILRCVASLETYDKGSVKLADNARIGVVSQNFNLFNNMSVLRNLAYPQEKILKRSNEEAEGLSIQMLKLVNMVHYFDKYPHELSGGQAQRVAIARTLCMDPSLILFDEPTSALDPENVIDILNLISSIISSTKAMMIVSHEIRFIRSIASRMFFIDQGQIKVDKSKDEFFNMQHEPRLTEFLEAFLKY